MAEKVFYEVISGGNKIPVRDLAAHERLDGIDTTLEGHIGDETHLSAGERTKWDNATTAIQSHSGNTSLRLSAGERTKWDNAAAAIASHSADTDLHLQAGERTKWDKAVSDLADHAGNSDIHVTAQQKADWTQTSADFAAHAADGDIHVTTTDKELWNTVEDKVDKTDFETYQQTVSDEFASTSAWALSSFQPSGDYVESDEFDEFVADVNANFSAVQDTLDEKLDITATTNWDVEAYSGGTFVEVEGHVINGKDWGDDIAAGDDAVKEWAEETFQPVGDYVSASELDDYYTKTEVDDLVEPFTTSAEVEEMVDELAEDVQEALSGLYNTEVVAGYGIQVEATTDPQTGDKTFEISTDPSVLNYGLFNTNETITYVSPSTVLGFTTNGDIQGESISLDTTTHQISLEPGSYHIDIQVNANIDGTNCALTNAYYDGILTAGPSPIRTVRMSIDGSYVHTETFTLSYDIKIEKTATLTFTMSGLPSGCQCSATLNIHEILTLEAAAEAISNNYTAGDGMKLENKSFSVNQGDGLEITQDNKLQVKLGKGLAFTDDHGIQAITIDPAGEVAEVVETVQELENAIATKITTNYPPAMITDSHAQVMAGTQYTPGNGGCLYGTLFNTPITHPVAIDKTFLGIYAYNGGIKAILGIYEYQPDYERKDEDTGTVTGFGRTVPLCDTGIITISQGFHEYPIKHLNNTIGGANPETTPELKTNCMYYATIYLGYASTAGANDLQVGCASGYKPQYGDIKPAMSMANVNNIKANIDVTSHSAYTEDLSFNDMGFNWQYTAYPARTTSTASTYFEANESPRMYMQIRNIK